jgi:hypothetical protein
MKVKAAVLREVHNDGFAALKRGEVIRRVITF